MAVWIRRHALASFLFFLSVGLSMAPTDGFDWLAGVLFGAAITLFFHEPDA